jgi:hypothetical protein
VNSGPRAPRDLAVTLDPKAPAGISTIAAPVLFVLN